VSIHQEVTFAASPERLYEILTDGGKFAAATGMPAEIEAAAGTSFSLFGGRAEGRHIELVPGGRVAQAWRLSDWESGVYSMVRFTLTRDGDGTKIALDVEAYPEGSSPLFPTWQEHLSTGWPMFYWEPFARYLAN
jgi:activator of HSP90 ATPase